MEDGKNMPSEIDIAVEKKKQTNESEDPRKLAITRELESDPIPSKSQFLIHSTEGRYLMDKCKWPTLTLPKEQLSQEEESLGDLTQETAIAGNKLLIHPWS